MLYKCRTITFTNKTSTLSVKTWYKKIIIKKLNLKYKVLMDIGQLRQWIHEYIIGVRCYTIICMYYTKCTDMGLKMSIIKTIYLTRGSSFILLFVICSFFFLVSERSTIWRTKILVNIIQVIWRLCKTLIYFILLFCCGIYYM